MADLLKTKRAVPAAVAVVIAAFLALLGAGALAAPRKTVEPPIITPDGGHYGLNATVRVAIRGESGSRLVYTLDDTLPEPHRGIRCDSNLVSFDLPPGDVIIHAIAIKPGLPPSKTSRAAFTRSGSR